MIVVASGWVLVVVLFDAEQSMGFLLGTVTVSIVLVVLVTIIKPSCFVWNEGKVILLQLLRVVELSLAWDMGTPELRSVA